MFNNNFNNGMFNNIPQGTGYTYNGMQPNNVVKFNNALTNEEIQRLMQKENQFSLQVTETESLRAFCLHRTPDGTGDTLVEDDKTGECRCYICNYVFRPLSPDTSMEMLKDSVDNVLDILQTIKLFYIDMPVEVAREYYMIIPLIEKIPRLFEYACKNYAQHTNINPYYYNNRNMSTMNLFNAVMSGVNGMAMQYQPQQQMNMQYQQPNMNMNVQQMYPQQQFMSNGLGYYPTNNVDPNMQAQPGAYQAASTGYQYTPTQAAQQLPMQQPVVTPSAPTAETVATTDGKDVQVTTTFKA